ncbi:hypothetical protein ACFL2H_06840, partial [Planctomycetota bacterium]
MSLPSQAQLIGQLSPPIDGVLAQQLVDEYVSIERRFILGDWEPAELDGGQFCEVLAKILYHLDSGNLNHGRPVSACISYLENNQVTHQHVPRKELLHLAKVISVVYKFRSDRGAVHISPTYSPNHMDSRMILENVRWMFAETLRIFWNADRNEVAKAVQHILRFDTPCIGVYGERTLVQRVGLTVEEEILVLLHHAGTDGMTRNELGKATYGSASSVTTSLKKLTNASYRVSAQEGGCLIGVVLFPALG